MEGVTRISCVYQTVKMVERVCARMTRQSLAPTHSSSDSWLSKIQKAAQGSKGRNEGNFGIWPLVLHQDRLLDYV